MVKFGGKIGTFYQMLKNAFKKHPLQNRTNVQIKGGGVKGLLNNVQKNCTFLTGRLPLVSKHISNFALCNLFEMWISQMTKDKMDFTAQEIPCHFLSLALFPILQILAMIGTHVHRHIGNDWHTGESKLGKAVTGENQSTSLRVA